MTQWINTHWKGDYDILNIFANTGEENEETLEFAHQCDKYFDLNLVWVEADVQHGKRKSTQAKVVSFETASRNGEPFEEVIKKYGIPNRKFPHCTRELKENPIKNYARSIGWGKGDYVTAIGIRIDEIDRMNASADRLGLIYPLVSDVPMSKKDINAYWNMMPFRLQLKGYQGNCKVCWKKSYRKLLTIAHNSPGKFQKFWQLEKDYEHFTPPTRNESNPPYRFFRGDKTVNDIFNLLKEGDFKMADDDSVVYSDNEDKIKDLLHELNLDDAGGCSESCEVFTV